MLRNERGNPLCRELSKLTASTELSGSVWPDTLTPSWSSPQDRDLMRNIWDGGLRWGVCAAEVEKKHNARENFYIFIHTMLAPDISRFWSVRRCRFISYTEILYVIVSIATAPSRRLVRPAHRPTSSTTDDDRKKNTSCYLTLTLKNRPNGDGTTVYSR